MSEIEIESKILVMSDGEFARTHTKAELVDMFISVAHRRPRTALNKELIVKDLRACILDVRAKRILSTY